MRWLPARREPRVDEHRWVVVDVEAGGLDPARDSFLAIGAVGLQVDWPRRSLAIGVADSFEVVLRQESRSTRENILVHGIGAARQAAGTPPQEAMVAFTRFVAASPLLAFHAAFDRTLLERFACDGAPPRPANAWLDVEHLCRVAHPRVRARSLDEWLSHFGISCVARHHAAADALATAELLARIWPGIAAECRSWRDVRRLAASHRWVAGA